MDVQIIKNISDEYKIKSFTILYDNSLKFTYKWETKKIQLNGKLLDVMVEFYICKNENISYKANELFWEHIFPIHNIVICASSHTPDGYKFWERLINDAFNKNYSVYILDLQNNNHTEIFDMQSLDKDL